MAKRKHRKIYNYDCTITGEKYKMTREAPNPKELVSVNAFYEFNQEKDDRPEQYKIKAAEQMRVQELSQEEQADDLNESKTDE